MVRRLAKKKKEETTMKISRSDLYKDMLRAQSQYAEGETESYDCSLPVLVAQGWTALLKCGRNMCTRARCIVTSRNAGSVGASVDRRSRQSDLYD